MLHLSIVKMASSVKQIHEYPQDAGDRAKRGPRSLTTSPPPPFNYPPLDTSVIRIPCLYSPTILKPFI